MYHKYIDQLAENYIARKITNIKTVENHLDKLSRKGAIITAKKLDKLFDKLNKFNDLPLYTTDYNPINQKQSSEDRLDKFNNSDYKKKLIIYLRLHQITNQQYKNKQENKD